MKDPYEIATPRLRLYAPSVAEIAELIRGNRSAITARIGATIPSEWPGPNLLHSLPIITTEMTLQPGDARWVWMIIETASTQVIGDIGFHSPLRADATVEIGYVLLPGARGQGYATEATTALIGWTFAHTQVAQIIAQIDPANTASIRVVEKLGMQPLAPISEGHVCFGISRSQYPAAR